jgi:hypothetical protein
MTDVFSEVQKKARDHGRLPMQVSEVSVRLSSAPKLTISLVGRHPERRVHHRQAVDARQ